MKKILLLLAISLFLISGCMNQTICNPPYMNFEDGCCLDNNNNQICDSDETIISPEEEVVGNDKDENGCIPSAGYSWCEEKQKCLRSWEEECIEEKEPTYIPVIKPTTKSSSYYMKLGESIDFNANKIKLASMDQTMGEMEVMLEINSIPTAFYSTNTKDIFQNINISITKTDFQKREVTIEIEEPTFSENEIILIKDKPITFAGYIITLNDVQKYDENIIVSVNGLQQRANIVEGRSKIFGDIEITNVDGKYRKENYQRYAIVKFKEL